MSAEELAEVRAALDILQVEMARFLDGRLDETNRMIDALTAGRTS